MKKVIFFCLCSFLSYQLLAQPFEKKQITNFNYDSKGAAFPSYPIGISFFSMSPFFYEAHTGNSVNVMMMNYNPDTDSFFNPIRMTDNNFLNINPIAFGNPYYPNRKMSLIWQTNENGNWDIAMRTLTDSIWSERKFIQSSSFDETNPQGVLNKIWASDEFDFEILYEKNNSIYLYQQKDSIIQEELVFCGNDSTIYYQPTGIHAGSGPWMPPAGLYVAAACGNADSLSKIVYRYRPVNDTIWSDIHIAFDSGFCQSPKFFRNYEYPWLSLEMTTDGVKRIIIISDMNYLGQNQYGVNLLDDPNVSTSDLSTFEYLIVTQKKFFWNDHAKFDFFISSPYTYKLISNDSVFAVYSPYYWSAKERFYTNLNNTKISIGNLGVDNYFRAVSYTIWEDSSNGYINLFGVKRLDPIGDVNDKIISVNFILYQNYPNPFNPKTIIKYELLSRDHVTIKVFDVLGKEVAALVNEEKDAGEYKTVFDGLNLASGIYVYRLSVGNHHLSRKMILLK